MYSIKPLLKYLGFLYIFNMYLGFLYTIFKTLISS